jgi:glycosyltransferase involved in cell wall biosynthesis
VANFPVTFSKGDAIVNRYVCAFRGRRDNYQLPLALAETGLLEEFITDFYAIKIFQKIQHFLPENLQQKLEFRSEPNIPTHQIRCLWRTTSIEQIRHRLGFSVASTFAWLDADFSHAAATTARKTKSHLLLYTPYAWEAFIANYSHNPKKVLFQFHPHADAELKLLTADIQRFPYMQSSYQEETRQYQRLKERHRIQECWKYADLIISASHFTQQTLIEAGANPQICRVIPYGVNLPTLSISKPPDRFQALFVGSGIQRKGLHHLLLAWKQANLPKDSELTLVCRHLDPGLKPLILETPRIRFLPGITTQQLYHLYTTSSLFVLPSLIEGFGQVFLEALSYGCPVLGTLNTGLRDLGSETEGIFLTEVGNVEQLANRLEQLANNIPQRSDLRQKARACAEKFSWSKFRNELCDCL